MAVEYEGGVIIGADSRTSTGYVPQAYRTITHVCITVLMLLIESLTSSHQ